jgi:hypothetical protein
MSHSARAMHDAFLQWPGSHTGKYGPSRLVVGTKGSPGSSFLHWDSYCHPLHARASCRFENRGVTATLHTLPNWLPMWAGLAHGELLLGFLARLPFFFAIKHMRLLQPKHSFALPFSMHLLQPKHSFALPFSPPALATALNKHLSSSELSANSYSSSSYSATITHPCSLISIIKMSFWPRLISSHLTEDDKCEPLPWKRESAPARR